MGKMGFDSKWVALVMNCIYSITYSVNMNGKRGYPFRPSRGLREGDPFSPFLFLICNEGLSTSMRLTVRDGAKLGARASRNGPNITYLLFADYYILFEEATLKGLNVLKGILDEYEAMSS